MSTQWGAALAPGGTLRVAINLGNAVLAQRHADTGALQGVSVVLAEALAGALGLPVQWQVHLAAGPTFEALRREECDLAFLAIDPQRSADVAFTTPYVLIEGAFLVRRAAGPWRLEDIDQPGRQIAANAGSAYDLHLARTLKHAQLRRWPTASQAFDGFVHDGLDAAAGVRQVLQRYAAQRPALQVLDEPFMVIQQAMAVPRGRHAILPPLTAFLEAAKASGQVAQALLDSGQRDAVVAAAAPVPGLSGLSG